MISRLVCFKQVLVSNGHEGCTSRASEKLRFHRSILDAEQGSYQQNTLFLKIHVILNDTAAIILFLTDPQTFCQSERFVNGNNLFTYWLLTFGSLQDSLNA